MSLSITPLCQKPKGYGGKPQNHEFVCHQIATSTCIEDRSPTPNHSTRVLHLVGCTTTSAADHDQRPTSVAVCLDRAALVRNKEQTELLLKSSFIITSWPLPPLRTPATPIEPGNSNSKIRRINAPVRQSGVSIDARGRERFNQALPLHYHRRQRIMAALSPAAMKTRPID
jgi:hypothetical protein